MGNRQRNGRWGWMVVTGGLALTGVAGLAAYKHQDLLAAWNVHQLPQAQTDQRLAITEQLAQNPSVSTGWILYSLSQATEPEEASVFAEALMRTSRDMDAEQLDPHISRAASLFKSMEPDAQAETLRWLATALNAGDPETMTERRSAAIRRLMDQAYVGEEPEVKAGALRLSGPILKQRPPAEVVESLKLLVSSGARSDSARVQIQAITAALWPALDCLEETTVCLKSQHREVRKAAILALGPATEKINEEILLPGLHDEDLEIVQLTQSALQARGLRDDQIRLGKLMADPKPTKRLEVLDHLSATRDIDPALWLRKLSNDPSPAVRAAAMRAMAQETGGELGERVGQMGKSDPSESVNKLAGYYGAPKMER